MFVTSEDLYKFTGYKRPSAQARFLAERRIVFTTRADGTIALRLDELDSHTLSKEKRPYKRTWQPDFSSVNKPKKER